MKEFIKIVSMSYLNIRFKSEKTTQDLFILQKWSEQSKCSEVKGIKKRHNKISHLLQGP
jgi:hypothetical protein